MDGEEKSMVVRLHAQGVSFSKIAEQLNISVNTIKSFCGRNTNTQFCFNCSKPVVQPRGARYKKFCSDKCRMKWWNTHTENVKRKAVYEFRCGRCGCVFQAYGNDHRKYCSRNCYVNARFGGKNGEFTERTDVSDNNEYRT